MFDKSAFAALAVVWLGATAVAPAGAESPVPSPVANGRRCSFASVTDPQVEGGEGQASQINGGPLVAATPGAQITMTCTIQVGAANSTHAGADECTAANGPSLQMVVVPPTPCSYSWPPGPPVWLCTEIEINGTTWHWDATPKDPVDPTNPETARGWTPSAGAQCNEATSREIFPGPFTPVRDILQPILDELFLIIDGLLETVDGLLDPIEQEIDTVICGTLADLAPGVPGVIGITDEGDVYVLGYLFWDCPVYGNGNEDGRFLDAVPFLVSIDSSGSVVAPPGCTTVGTTVTCGPGAVPGQCDAVEVWVDADGTDGGTVTGTSECANATPSATASTTALGGNYASTRAAALSPTPWTCRATVTTTGPWRVTCAAWAITPAAPTGRAAAGSWCGKVSETETRSSILNCHPTPAGQSASRRGSAADDHDTSIWIVCAAGNETAVCV